MEDAVKRIEEGTGCLAVSQIGRTVILYRPSVTKLKAEEKKKQAQREYLKKKAIFQVWFMLCIVLLVYNPILIMMVSTFWTCMN